MLFERNIRALSYPYDVFLVKWVDINSDVISNIPKY